MSTFDAAMRVGRAIGAEVAATAARTSPPAGHEAVRAAGQPTRSAAASAAIALLGSAEARTPTGAVRDALDAGRLLRTGDPARLDQLEQVLRTGTIDRERQQLVAGGMNGDLHKVPIADATAPGGERWAIEKSAGAQAPQEELGWRLARALGIDHLVAAVARREDGVARIDVRSGRAFSLAGITDTATLERALATSYADDATLALTPAEAAQAARIDRQLIQVFDYLLANNDRSASNGAHDAATGVTSLYDSGHVGRGTLAVNGGTDLEPALQLFQAGTGGGRVDLDPEVVELLRRRLSPDALREMHAAVFDAPGMPGPAPRTFGERFLPHVRSEAFRESIVQRFEHLLEHGGYTHRPYRGDAAGAGTLPPLVEREGPRTGLRAVRGGFGGFGAGGGGFDRW